MKITWQNLALYGGTLRIMLPGWEADGEIQQAWRKQEQRSLNRSVGRFLAEEDTPPCEVGAVIGADIEAGTWRQIVLPVGYNAGHGWRGKLDDAPYRDVIADYDVVVAKTGEVLARVRQRQA